MYMPECYVMCAYECRYIDQDNNGDVHASRPICLGSCAWFANCYARIYWYLYRPWIRTLVMIRYYIKHMHLVPNPYIATYIWSMEVTACSFKLI